MRAQPRPTVARRASAPRRATAPPLGALTPRAPLQPLASLVVLALMIAVALGSAGATVEPDARRPVDERLPAFPLERLEPGLQGFGLTAGPGNAIERFSVTVLALQEAYGPGGLPLVLVETGGPLIEAAGGVAAGMSGSPVYLDLDDERALLGAIGYVFPDADGALALVTPIDAMRDQTDIDDAAVRLPPGARPVATPVLVAGLGERALAFLDETVLGAAPVRLEPLRGGGAGAASAPATDRPAAEGRADDATGAPPQAGSAAAIQLIRGDVTVAAIGTVTEVTGREVLALGHPFLGTGPASWALAPAEVTAIVPGRRVPFKLANVAPGLWGTVVADWPAGVAARLDQPPASVPVTLSLTADGRSEVLRFDVAAHEALWPALVAVATLEGLDRTWRRVAAGSASLAWELELEGGPPLRLVEDVSSERDLALAAARMAAAPLALLAQNPFEAPRPLGLQVVIEVDERRRDGELVEALLEAGPVQAGSSVGLLLRLQPWRAQGEVHTITVPLPEALDPDAELVVRGAGVPRDDEHEGGVDTLVLSYAELLTVLRERPRSGDLVVEVRGADGRWELLERRSFPYLVRGLVRVPLPLTEADDGAE